MHTSNFISYNVPLYLIISRYAGLWFSPGTPVPSPNIPDRHDITEILLKVALNDMELTPYVILLICPFWSYTW